MILFDIVIVKYNNLCMIHFLRTSCIGFMQIGAQLQCPKICQGIDCIQNYSSKNETWRIVIQSQSLYMAAGRSGCRLLHEHPNAGGSCTMLVNSNITVCFYPNLNEKNLDLIKQIRGCSRGEQPCVAAPIPLLLLLC